MPEEPSDFLERDPGLNQPRGVGVAEVVDADVADSCGGEGGAPGAAAPVAEVGDRAVVLEHVAAASGDDRLEEVRAVNAEDSTIVGFAQQLDDSDPRSVARAGGRTLVHSSPAYRTKPLAEAGARTRLRQSLSLRSRKVTVTCTPEALLLELGDYGTVRDPVQRREVRGEVVGMNFPLDPTSPPVIEMVVGEEGGDGVLRR